MQPSHGGVATIGTETVWPHPSGDPRLRFPALDEAGVFTARRLHKWLTERRCLCGCGRRTQFIHSRQNSGQWSYFTHHCWANLAREVGITAPSATTYPARRDPKWLEGVRRENEARRCTREETSWYITLLLADIEDRGLNYRSWAREKGLSLQFVGSLVRVDRSGRCIQKYTAGTILKALGEKMPDDIKTRYVAHQRTLRKRAREQAQRERVERAEAIAS